MNKKLGEEGEKLVAQYLAKSLGYKIIETNVNCGSFGEIDIVAKDKSGMYIFVEVKSRSSDRFMNILESIDYRKKRALKNAALFYVNNNNLNKAAYRIDLLTYNKYTNSVEMFEDVLG